MTSTTVSAPSALRRRTGMLAAAGIACSAIVIAVGNYHVPKGEDGGLGEALATAILCAVIAAVLFALVVPRIGNRERAALVLGVLTVLSLAVFWSGVTPILAAAALAVAPAELAPSRRAGAVRWISGVGTALVLVWTLANSHLF